ALDPVDEARPAGARGIARRRLDHPGVRAPAGASLLLDAQQALRVVARARAVHEVVERELALHPGIRPARARHAPGRVLLRVEAPEHRRELEPGASGHRRGRADAQQHAVALRVVPDAERELARRAALARDLERRLELAPVAAQRPLGAARDL